MQKTRTFKYLFPSVYFSENGCISHAMDKLAQKDCLFNAYINDVDYQGDPKEKLFILVKTNSNNILDLLLPTIVECDIYDTHYEVGNDHFIIVIKVVDIKAYEAFIESKYSEMYTIKFLKDNFKVRSRPVQAYHILAKTEEKREEIIKDLGLKDDFEAEEYDSLINVKEETFNKSLLWVHKDLMKEN